MANLTAPPAHLTTTPPRRPSVERRASTLAGVALVDEFNRRLATRVPLDAGRHDDEATLRSTLSLPELDRRQPPSASVPHQLKPRRTFSTTRGQRQRVSPAGAATAEQQPQASPAVVRERLSVRPDEAAHAPGRRSTLFATPPAAPQGFRSRTMALEMLLAAALGDESTKSPTEERAAACFAVLRGLADAAAEEFRPLLQRLTLELQHAVYDEGEHEHCPHFVQLERSRTHAGHLRVEVGQLKAERQRMRAEMAAMRRELGRLDRPDAEVDEMGMDELGVGGFEVFDGNGTEVQAARGQSNGSSQSGSSSLAARRQSSSSLRRRGSFGGGGGGSSQRFALPETRPEIEGEGVDPIHAHLFDLRVAHQREMEELQQAMVDMVPSDENEALKQQLGDTRERLQTALEAAKEWSEDAGATGAELDSLRTQLADARQRLAGMERAWTPRPPWQTLNEAAAALRSQGGVTSAGGAALRVAGLRAGQPSRANLTAVGATLGQLWSRLAELEERLPNDSPFHVGLGVDASVPVHLRHHGRLRNRRMAKAEVERDVKRVWRAKEEADRAAAARGAEAPSLSEVFARLGAAECASDGVTGHRDAAVEWCYNVVDGCRRYGFDADLELFLAVLRGAAPEHEHYAQEELLRRLHAALRSADAADGAQRGWCSVEAAMAAVDSLYPTLVAEKGRQLRRLLDDAASASHEGEGEGKACARPGQLNYERLMADDADENQGPFVEALREAHASEPRDFLRCFHAMLHAKLSAASGLRGSPVATSPVSGSPNGNGSPRKHPQPSTIGAAPSSKGDAGLVTAATVRGVVSILDPGRPADDVREILTQGFAGAYKAKAVPWQTRKGAAGNAMAPPPDTATIRIDKLIANLRPSFPRWISGKPQDLDTLLALSQQQ